MNDLFVTKQVFHKNIMNKHLGVYLFFEVCLFSSLLRSAQLDDCMTVFECPAALDILLNKPEPRRTLDKVKCGFSGTLPKVRCREIPNFDTLALRIVDKNACISIYDCPSAVDLMKNHRNEVIGTEILRAAHCGYEGRLPLTKCDQVKQELEGTSTVLRGVKPAPPVTCITPNGLKGECVELSSCPRLKQGAKRYLGFLERSRCDSSNPNKVCCGPDDGFGNECGISTNEQIQYNLYGGEITRIRDYPWMVILKYNSTKRNFGCGGSLINSQFVLTAAHCIIPDLISVRVGVHNNKEETDGSKEVRIIKAAKHEKREHKHEYDIGLIKIEKVPYQDNIRWICLPPIKWNLPQLFTVVGYGDNDKGIAAFTHQFEVKLQLVDQYECIKLYPGRETDVVLCAGGDKGVSICGGDSGGPLIGHNGTARWYLYGIVAHGYPCSIDLPGLFTRIDTFIPWINKKMLEML